MGSKFGNLVIHVFNPLNAELNPIRHLIALVGARHIVHVSRIGVKNNKDLCNLSTHTYITNTHIYIHTWMHAYITTHSHIQSNYT